MLSGSEGGGIVLYYGVEDVAEAYRLACEGGGGGIEPPRVIAEVEGKPIHLAILQDGEGNMLGLISG